MKKTIFRYLACVMVITMILSVMTACTQTASKTPTSEATAQSSETSKAAAETTASTTEATTAAETTAPPTEPPATPVPKEPITLTYGDNQGSPAQIVSGVQTDPVSLQIQKETGVSLDFDTTANDVNKIKAMIASGTLPDIMALSDTSLIPDLIKSNLITDVTDLIESNGANIKAVASTALQFYKDNFSNDTGRLFAVPTRISVGGAGYNQPYIGFFMRWDYFKEIGKPVLNTMDDVTDAIIAIQKKYPVTADGKKTYGTSFFTDWGLWNYTVISQVMRGQSPCGTSMVCLQDKDYNFIDGLMDDKAALWVDGKFYNTLYRAGIMDPDSFTQGYDQAVGKFNADQYICEVKYWILDAQNTKLKEAGADYVNIPSKDVVYDVGVNPIGSKYYIVSSKCKAPDRAVDVLNWMFSDEGVRTMLDGVKGETWTYDESGKAVLTEKGRNLKNDPNYMLNSGAMIYLNSTGIDPMSKDSTMKQFVDLFYEPDVQALLLSKAQKECLEYFGAKSTNELYSTFGNGLINGVYGKLSPVPSDEAVRTDAAITAYLVSALPKLLMAADDAAFAAERAKITNDVKAIPGYQALVDETKANLKMTKDAGDKYK